MSETRDLLMRTKRLFTSGRWVRGSLHEHGDVGTPERYCLIGGLRHSAGHDPYVRPQNNAAYAEALRLLSAEVNEAGPVNWQTQETAIVIYNDRTARAVDDVVALIDRAVEKVSDERD